MSLTRRAEKLLNEYQQEAAESMHLRPARISPFERMLAHTELVRGGYIEMGPRGVYLRPRGQRRATRP